MFFLYTKQKGSNLWPRRAALGQLRNGRLAAQRCACYT